MWRPESIDDLQQHISGALQMYVSVREAKILIRHQVRTTDAHRRNSSDPRTSGLKVNSMMAMIEQQLLASGQHLEEDIVSKGIILPTVYGHTDCAADYLEHKSFTTWELPYAPGHSCPGSPGCYLEVDLNIDGTRVPLTKANLGRRGLSKQKAWQQAVDNLASKIPIVFKTGTVEAFYPARMAARHQYPYHIVVLQASHTHLPAVTCSPIECALCCIGLIGKRCSVRRTPGSCSLALILV